MKHFQITPVQKLQTLPLTDSEVIRDFREISDEKMGLVPGSRRHYSACIRVLRRQQFLI